MHRKTFAVLLLALVVAVGFIGCAGEDGAQGPQGPSGNDGQDMTAVTYKGYTNLEWACGSCHGAEIVASYEGTAHSHAYADLVADGDENSPYCVQCHTTGWDATVARTDTVIVNNDGPDQYGFDNYFQVEGDYAAARRAQLANVQCESCHGPKGSKDGMIVNNVTVTTEGDATGAMCNPCHSQYNELAEAGHIQNANTAHGNSCDPCHTAEGFIKANDSDYGIALDDFSITNINAFVGIGDVKTPFGCQTCHDPHSDEGENYQLRSVKDVPISSQLDRSFTELGQGQLCVQCHHDRRTAENIASNVSEGASGHSFGPHHSPQADMYYGVGAPRLVGAVYDTIHAHQTSSGFEGLACVRCHMQRNTTVHGTPGTLHSSHTFTPIAAPEVEGAGNTGSCAPCHTDITTDFSQHVGAGHDITTIDNKMEELAVALGFTDLADFEANYSAVAAGQDSVSRCAAYDLEFVINDGSHGVHNPDYAYDLLQNAIDELP
ncbi:MAG: ammonia-forming cytochrome c nitrite reductase subunit c552 [bacterium]